MIKGRPVLMVDPLLQVNGLPKFYLVTQNPKITVTFPEPSSEIIQLIAEQVYD